MVVSQVIPAIVRQSVVEARLITVVGDALKRNQDIKAARDSLVAGGKPKDQATLDVVLRNPDIKQTIINNSWDIA
jgi:hypothetical protein